ncbi:olfactory receptor 6N2-like [Eleginops maclovinus]|uniref:olfactory receptor 6N2-like n=1 Tax=Eleginops maclovinus TaxID=56733 RepID=UPI003080ABF4
MDVQFNVTYITLEGHVEVHRYRYLYFVIMFTVYVLILCSNSTIVSIIVIHRNLHEPMYMFIAALMVNSVLFSCAIYPKLLLDFLSEKQVISYTACLIQYFLYYSLSGTEFFLLAAMSYDRYVSICKPLQYPNIMRTTTVNMLLILAWLLPACQVSVPRLVSANKKLCKFNLKGVICNSTVQTLYCGSSRVVNIYGTVILVVSVIFPVLFILVTYIRIVIVCYRSSKEVRRRAAQTCLPHLLVLLNFTCLIAFDVIITRQKTDFPKTVRLIMSLQVLLYHPLINPIIYGLKMTEIYKHLKRLFCKRV